VKGITVHRYTINKRGLNIKIPNNEIWKKACETLNLLTLL